MLDQEILELREKLDNSILKGEKYEIVYKLSVELDEAIAKYYRKKINIKCKSIALEMCKYKNKYK